MTNLDGREDEDLAILFRIARHPLPAPRDPQLAAGWAHLGVGPEQQAGDAVAALARAATDPLRSPANRARAETYLERLAAA
ncbi:hypothetical protein [Caulobacter sp. S45]|uniref:hypothetical protein n=1 Tax=Caulobacter sp. S45 TaxID=1641861 RepID=UPI00131E7BD5|nr:hypothetical protein [Caulobacter sp. S45]